MTNSISDIRQTFLDFFHNSGHQVIESSSLLPDNNPTLLFTNAGMNQFKDLFLGLDKPLYQRATSSQRCIRAGGKHNDLENVGYTARHHTFFEMLGNFSFGDYFKYDAIQFAWTLLTGAKWFNLPKDKLWVTVYITDYETYNIWANEIGVPHKRIIRIGNKKGNPYASDNFWQMSDTGPCGPCSEIFYDHGDHIPGGPPGSPEEEGDRYIEIWNLVFMQFNRLSDGTLLPLSKTSVDTGMGLERIAMVMQHVNSSYDIDLFRKLISDTAQIIGTTDLKNKSLRVISDHIRSCAFLISDGVLPANEGGGYVLRRIIRRAIRHGKILGSNDAFFYQLVEPLIEVMGNAADPLKAQRYMVEKILRTEEELFSRTLERGLAQLDEALKKLTGNTLEGNIAYRLYDTYGFPLDLTADICREHDLKVDEVGFERAMEEQRKRGRASSGFSIDYKSILHINQSTHFFGYETVIHPGQITALFRNGKSVELITQGEEVVVVLDQTPFYGESGGQVGDQGELTALTGIFEVVDTKKYGQAFGHLGTLKDGELKIGMQVSACVDQTHRNRISLNHSATHLLHATLRQVLGKHVWQRGSVINDQYLRFDFSHHEAMEASKIRHLEDIVNQKIRQNIPIQTETMTLEEAQKKGAIALFGNKYKNQVRVVSMDDFSTELCGGIHAHRTGDIGLFRIVSECSIATGIRRIEAMTGEGALTSLHQQSDLILNVSKLLKSDNHHLIKKIIKFQERARQLEKKIQKLQNQQVAKESKALRRNVRNINKMQVLIKQVENIEPKMLRAIIEDLKNQLGAGIIILASVAEEKVNIIASVTNNLTDRIKATDIIDRLAKQIGGKGGGHAHLAQAKGNDVVALTSALAGEEKMLATQL